ncbi:Hypothetical predicted protein [Octopus vulgaris]|uniref:Uncharacterized protein n=1 Tax=Octopus vulgaris TaxID=6645 RepID=A0AA36F330_OCTVU|nr:Hypothetical predicted protein [Octopus vulgaris]
MHEDSKQASIMNLSQKFEMSLGLQVYNKNDQRHPNTDRPTIASPDLEINNQKDLRDRNSDKPITDAKTFKNRVETVAKYTFPNRMRCDRKRKLTVAKKHS